MENKESDIEESKILYFINNASSNDESVRQQATQYLQSCTFQLQLLPTFYNILQQCIANQSQSNIYYCLLILRDTIINRGCLYSPENHMNHIKALFSIAENAVDLISNNIAILNIFSDAVSFSYRFIYEKTNEFPKIVFKFYESSGYHKIIAMSTLISILNAIEKPMPHKPEHISNIKKFKFFLPGFFAYSFQSISIIPSEGNDSDTIKRINMLGIELFNKATEHATDNFTFSSEKNYTLNFNIDYFLVEGSENIAPSFYYLDCLFSFFNEWDPQNAIKAGQSIKNYLYLCNLIKTSNLNPNNVHKKDILNTILYLIYKVNQLLSVLINSPANEDFVHEGYDKRDITPLLVMISNSMNLLLRKDYVDSLVPAFKFFIDGAENEGIKGSGIKIIFDFLTYTVEYTKNFILIDPNEFFIFWKIIANSNFHESILQPIIDNVKNVFEFYINYLLEVNESLEQKAENFFGFSNGGDFIHGNLWGMMRGSIVDASILITRSIEQIVEDEKDRELDSSFVVSYQRIIIITTLFTSFINDYGNLTTIFSQNDEQNDFNRAFESIFLTIFNFIIYHSENLNERLNIIGEFVAKAEFCFASLFKSFYKLSKQRENMTNFQKSKLEIEKKISNEVYSTNKIQNFFIDHFVDVIKIFTPYTDLLLFILDILDTISMNDQYSYMKNNKLREISLERLQPFDLETVPFIYLQKVIPKLYKIYSSVVNKKEWNLFLSSFDPQFSDELVSPPKCFLLYSQLLGVCMHSERIEDLIKKTFKWILENHFEDTIKCLQTHFNDKIIVTIIVELWLKISAINSPYKGKIFTDENGNGILYFRANVQILLILKELCEDSQWISMKLIHNCICGDYANYGIMEFFQDNSLSIILENFFYLLQNWAIGENSERLILITKIIKMFHQIGLSEKVLFPVEENLFCVLGFLVYNLLLPNEDENKKNVWIETCNCLYFIIGDAIVCHYPVRKFSQFFILILDALITLPFYGDDNLANSAANTLFLLMYHDTEFCHKVTDTVIETFEADYAGEVNRIFESFWLAVLGNQDDIQRIQDLRPPNNFKFSVQTFSKEMKTYHVEIANIAVFQDIFRRSG